MAENTKRIAFVLLIIGTFGLIINEFLFDWGRSGTLFFATLNVFGIFSLEKIISFTARKYGISGRSRTYE